MRPDAKRLAAFCASGLVLLGIVLAVLPLIGSTSISLAGAFRGESPHAEILFHARLPRVLLAALAGAALATAGLLFQALVRDSLADPYTLGISGGASLGAVLALCFRLPSLFGLPAVGASAFLGALITLALVLAISTRGLRMSSFTLLLAGVTVNSICMASLLLLHSVADFGQSFVILRWLMGGIESVSYPVLGFTVLALVPAFAYVLARSRDLNLVAIGEEWAEARGLNVRRAMLGGLIAGSWLTGVVTSLTGPIGFLGLIVPHALRLRLGADHRLLAPAAMFAGAAFLALCDTAARTVAAPAEVPVGVITAMLGGPFFIWLLRRGRGSVWL
jgi:iron complex transport system permease protein